MLGWAASGEVRLVRLLTPRLPGLGTCQPVVHAKFLPHVCHPVVMPVVSCLLATAQSQADALRHGAGHL